MIQTINKLGIEGKHLNILKSIYDRPTGNIILNNEKIMELLKLNTSYQDLSDLHEMTSSFTFRNGTNM